MKKIYLDIMTKTKDQNGWSYDKIRTRIEERKNVFISTPKLQRIFTGQQDATVADFELIIEDGLGLNLMEVYARMGEQEFRDSEVVDYKGAKELLEDFKAEKEQIRKSYDTQIEQLIKAREETQQAFSAALEQMSAQYKKNADYLVNVVKDDEEYIRDLLAKTEHSNAIAIAAQKRSEEAEKRADEATERADSAEKENRTTRKKMYMLFSAMLFLVVFVVALLALGIVLDLPQLGMGNM